MKNTKNTELVSQWQTLLKKNKENPIITPFFQEIFDAFETENPHESLQTVRDKIMKSLEQDKIEFKQKVRYFKTQIQKSEKNIADTLLKEQLKNF